MKKQQTGLVVLTIVCALSLALMIFSLTRDASAPKPAFTPPPFDSGAVKGTPEVPEDLGWREMDAQAFLFAVCGKVILQEERADIWLTNPESNTVWMKARIMDENGAILGETGLIRPGEFVQTIRFTSIPEEGTAIGIKIMAYQPDTYYSEGAVTLNTHISKGESE